MELKKNDLITVTIEDMGAEGEGIGKIDGFPLFIKDAIIGDEITARILKTKKNYAYARVEKVLKPSPFRVTPKCEYYRQCGGCQIQAMDYKKQLEFKNSKVKNNLMRIGGFEESFVNSVLEPIVGMEDPYRYRNKAQYPIGEDKEGNPIAGFYAGRTHCIISNTSCYLGVTENEDILKVILGHMKENKISAYNEETGKGLFRHVLIRKGFTSGEIMVCMILNMKGKISTNQFIKNQDILVKKLSEIPGMTSISVNINAENTNVIMGKETHCIWGSPTIRDVIHVRDMKKEGYPFTGQELTFAISPLSFYQVNPMQTEKLYSLALEYAGLTGKEIMWDLYCGIGTISLFMATKAKKVCGVEIIPQAIEDAKENAKRNHIENAEFFVGKAEEVLPKFTKENIQGEMLHPDVIVVDPPRKGCDEICLQTMVSMAPDRIVYVSCDSATLARDLKFLCENGYELKKVRPVDQFAHTVHVETVVLLSQLRHKPDDYIDVDVDVAELEGTSAETKATYEKIKKYVAEHNDGMKVSNLYIAQVKRKCGIELAENFNLPKSEDSRQPQCPKDKERAIVEALKYFQMI